MVPSIVHNVLRSPGRPLDAATRTFFELRFGHDFSKVRVHTDENAAESAKAVQAHAYTVGQDVVFARSRYAPGTAAGDRLLAHELTHVLQQWRSDKLTAEAPSKEAVPSLQAETKINRPGDSHEQEAERIANEIMKMPTEPGQETLANRRTRLSHAPAPALQRYLATPGPSPPAPSQPDLTQTQIRQAITYNSQFYDRANTRLIQQLLGGPVTGRWTAENIRAIAAVQEQYGLKKDGKVGVNTFHFIEQEQTLEGTHTDKANCLTSFRFVFYPIETAATPGFGGTTAIRGHHRVEARFSPRCNCSEFEYRQFIMGVATANHAGTMVDLGNFFSHVPGGRLPGTFSEDGSDPKHCPRNYGHRKQAAQVSTAVACGQNRYSDDTGAIDQAHGCVYQGEDFPQIRVAGLNARDTVDLLVQFRGQILRNGRPIETKQWTDIDTTVVTP